VEIISTSSDVYLTDYFAQVSGENLDLAKAEMEALVRLCPTGMVVSWYGRIAKLQTPVSPVEFLLDRAALVQRAGILLGEVIHDESITEAISDDIWRANVLPSDRFSVRTMCIGRGYDSRERAEIEKKLGAHIQNITGADVDLRVPKTQILVIIVPKRILVCKSSESRLRCLLRTRAPGKKPFFHPTMMNSTLARVMCNLAGVRPGNTVLDPFCGGGGILCEASHIGAVVLGSDLNWKLLAGATKNLSEISAQYSVVQADTRYLPIQTVDHIVTDPPYGRSSSTRGTESKRLVDSLLERVPSLLRPGEENLCVCGSSEMGLPEMIQENGFTLGRDIRVSVHRGLVREIVTASF
jgi:tRNA (guanine10-N2)-dimethyltransferase